MSEKSISELIVEAAEGKADLDSLKPADRAKAVQLRGLMHAASREVSVAPGDVVSAAVSIFPEKPRLVGALKLSQLGVQGARAGAVGNRVFQTYEEGSTTLKLEIERIASGFDIQGWVSDSNDLILLVDDVPATIELETNMFDFSASNFPKTVLMLYPEKLIEFDIEQVDV